MESVMTQVCMQFKWPWGLRDPQRVNNPTDQPLGGAAAVNECHSASLELRGGGRPQFRRNFTGLRRTGRAARREPELCGLWLEEKDRVQKLSARKRLEFQGGVTFLQGVGKRERERKNLCKPDKASENSQYPQRLRSCHWMCILGWMFYSVFVALSRLG